MNGWDILLKLAKVLLVGLLVVLLTTLIHGSTWHGDFKELRKRVESKLPLSDMQKGDEQLLRRLYGLNAGELKHWILYTAQDNMDVEELLLVEAAEEGQMELKLIEKYVLRESEPYVLFVISEDAEAVKAEFVKGLYR